MTPKDLFGKQHDGFGTGMAFQAATQLEFIGIRLDPGIALSSTVKIHLQSSTYFS